MTSRITRYALLVAAFAICVLAFWLNAFKTSSEFQFRTYRDGSEALVLGKVFADAVALPTGKVNLGFVEHGPPTKGPNVIAVYSKIDNPHAVVAANVTDENWEAGVSRIHPRLILTRASSGRIGYAPNDLGPSQILTFPNGDKRAVLAVSADPDYITVDFEGDIIEGKDVGYPRAISIDPEAPFTFDPYFSQFGIQGDFFSALYRYVPGIDSVTSMQLVAATLFTIVILCLANEFGRSISPSLGVIFLISMIASPWVVAKAQDLYWLPVLWILPALVAMWLYRRSLPIWAGLTLYFFAILLKSLAGYEYLTTIVLFSMVVFIADAFLPSPRFGRRASIAMVFGLGVVSLIGFSVAVLLHGYIRAGTIAEGVRLTLINDGLKFNQLSSVAQVPSRGLDPSLLEVTYKYVFEWPTPVLFWWAQPYGLPALAACSILALICQFVARMEYRWRDTAILLSMTAASLSWIVLMKGHSTIHVHLNYVLWYFGAVPAMVFVIWRVISAGTVTAYEAVKAVRG